MVNIRNTVFCQHYCTILVEYLPLRRRCSFRDRYLKLFCNCVSRFVSYFTGSDRTYWRPGSRRKARTSGTQNLYIFISHDSFTTYQNEERQSTVCMVDGMCVNIFLLVFSGISRRGWQTRSSWFYWKPRFSWTDGHARTERLQC